MSAMDDLRAMSHKINTLPPLPYAILAHHAVPYGRAYRQWDTNGRLLIWANRGEVADMPRAKAPYDFVGVSKLVPPSLTGIPVHYVPWRLNREQEDTNAPPVPPEAV